MLTPASKIQQVGMEEGSDFVTVHLSVGSHSRAVEVHGKDLDTAITRAIIIRDALLAKAGVVT